MHFKPNIMRIFFYTTSCVFLHPLFSLILQNLTQHEHFFTHLCNYVSIVEQKSLQYLMHHGTNYMDILTFLPLLIISLSMDDLQFTWEFVFFPANMRIYLCCSDFNEVATSRALGSRWILNAVWLLSVWLLSHVCTVVSTTKFWSI